MLNNFEKIIALVAPRAAVRRAQARIALDLISKRSYEGASKSRRTENWKTNSSSQNSENDRALPLLRDRARDLVRNEPFAANALEAIVAETIGYGIKSEIKNPSNRGLDEIRAAYREWAGTTQCDFDGRLNYYGIQELVMRTVVESGECLVIRRKVPSKEGFIPVKIQILEPDYLDTSKVEDGTVQGIKFNSDKKRVGYWIYKEHPGDTNFSFGFFKNPRFESELIPAEDVLHVFRTKRAGQIRAATWLAAVIIRLRDLDEYMDASLIKQKVAAAFAAFIHDIEMGDQSGDKATISDKLTPGIIEVLPPGKSVSFANPPTVAEFDPFTRSILRSIAVGMGISYEALSGDYSNVNFSSGRMGRLQFLRNVHSWRWNMFVPQFCDPVGQWFFEAAAMRGLKPANAYFTHTPPATEMINPTEEIKATKDAIRSGLKSLPEAQREQGYDPDDLLKEIQESNKKLDKMEIILDSDPRKIMASSGSLQAAQSATSATEPPVTA